MKLTHAMVLAAGFGKRMRPLTDHKPKPLVEVAGRPLIDYSLRLIEQAGIGSVVVNTHYLAQQIEHYLQQRPNPFTLHLSHETSVLETGGGIANALPHLGSGPFLSLNSDVITLNGPQPAIDRLSEYWGDHMRALLLVQPVARAVGYDGPGDFELRAGRLRRPANKADATHVFTGMQLLHPQLFAGAPQGAFSMNLLYDRERDAEGWLVGVEGLEHDGQWLHVGEPGAIALAESRLAELQANL